MSLLPLDPSLARALLAARDLKCLEQVGPAACKSNTPLNKSEPPGLSLSPGR